MTNVAVPSAELLARSDVVLRRGRFTLLNSRLTPHEAMVEDLLAVRCALDAAGINFLLVRRGDSPPVIAVSWGLRKALQEVLAEAFSTEPFYSKPVRRGPQPAVLVALGVLSSDPKTRVFRLFRPRMEPAGRLRYGASNGVQLELWSDDPITIVMPRANALTRRTLPRVEVERTTVERFGQSWPTLENMFAPLANDVTFDIDIVFSWVDGAAVEWQRKRAKRMESYVVGDGDASEARFRQLDELKFALRSVHMFAPWIRHIYIATDSPRPDWLAEHPWVSIIRSEEFFSDPSVLPTHNSHAVESQLHRIPGLSEHFLYSNDDMFFGRALSPELFFSAGGVTRFIESKTRIGLGDANPARSGFDNAARVNRRLLQERFGRTITRQLEHAATPLRKSVMLELEGEFPEEFARTSASPFRSATDISVTNSLYHYYALITGRAVAQTDVSVKYVDTTARAGLEDLDELLRKRAFDLFCLNDGSFPEVTAQERAAAVKSFLAGYFPIRAPWEVPDRLDAD